MRRSGEQRREKTLLTEQLEVISQQFSGHTAHSSFSFFLLPGTSFFAMLIEK
jgi:hypothetical protein